MLKIFVVLLLVVGVTAAASPPVQPATIALPKSIALTSRLLRDIPELQQKITLDATDRPVGEVVSSLSLQVDLSAERNVADQRVTLHLMNQPVYVLMDRLTRLLSHHPDTSEGYQWGHLDRAAGTRPAYQLWRDGHSVDEEQGALDYPRREIAVLLRDVRNMANLSPEDLAKYTGDLPFKIGGPEDSVIVRAFQGLSDSQIDALVAGQPLPLDPNVFAPEIAALHQKEVDQAQANWQSAQAYLAANPNVSLPGVSLSDPPPDVPLTPPMLSVTLNNDDAEMMLSDPAYTTPGWYTISLEGVSGPVVMLDTYDTNESRDPYRVPLPDVPHSGLVVDLTPLLTAKSVSPAQRRDVGFTLQALAHTAHINIYQEDFLHGSAQIEASEIPDAVGLTTLKGPLPVLIAAICAHWNYQWQKVGNDYLFWSRTWAQDRADDVPERLLAPWRQRLQKQRSLAFNDRADMAAALTWRQVGLTLATALPEAGPWDFSLYRTLHFVGLLSPLQASAASSESGLPLASLASWQQEAFSQNFQRQLKTVTEDQSSGAVITLQVEDASNARGQRVILTVKANDQKLMETRSFIPRSKP